MGVIQRIDRRSEPRTRADFQVTIWGVDTRGDRFLQEARACDISMSGALLSGIEVDLRCGDVIGLLYLGKRARYRVVWVRYDDGGDKIQAAIHRIEADACPWLELLTKEASPPKQLQRPDVTSDLS